jgi:membrane protease YdiL (CAAX protease family)
MAVASGLILVFREPRNDFMMEEPNMLEPEPLEPPTPVEPEPPVAPRPLPRGHTVLAWIAIVGLVVFSVLVQRQRSEERDVNQAESTAMPVMELQGRLLVGFSGIMSLAGGGDKQASSMIVAELNALDTGPVGQRLRYVILVGELEGPEQAADQLKELRETLAHYRVSLTDDQTRELRILADLYDDYQHGRYDARTLSESDRDFLEKNVRWFGALALAPKDSLDKRAREEVLRPAGETALMFLTAVALGGCVALGGLVLLVFVVGYWLPQRARQGSGGLGHAGVYAETFALWLALFWAVNFAAGYVNAGEWSLLVNALVDLATLGVLAWPVLRGVPWRQVRQDIGLTFGNRPWLEPIVGLGCYAMSLPILAVGMGIVVVLLHMQAASGTSSQAEFGLGGQPTHPIVGIAAGADAWGKFQVVLLACVIAPILEETVFRGLLYGHLRGVSARLGYGLSVFFSATVVSFIFAVIHPQGILFVPVLMSLAFGFALAREWRGSLIPGMVAHGLSNGLIMTLIMVGTS